MGKTSIEWCRGDDGMDGRVWNPVRGCSRVSTGCENCYAERVAARFSGPGQPYEGLAIRKLKTTGEGDEDARVVPRWTGAVRVVHDHLEDPLRWKKPTRIFVNSMSDLFHEGFSIDTIASVWAVMVLAHWHTHIVLTKRAERMHDVLTDPLFYARVLAAAEKIRDTWPESKRVGISNPSTSPASWIWLGVSVESQPYADERIPWLLETPALVRFISAEPLLGHLNIYEYMDRASGACGEINEVLDWVIAGAESGPGARTMQEDWVRSLRDQCRAAEVPFFYKQAATPSGRKIPLPALDGEQWTEFPQ